MFFLGSPIDDGDHVKQPEDDPGAEAEDGGTGERDVQRSPGPHGHRREKLWCAVSQTLHESLKMCQKGVTFLHLLAVGPKQL